MKLQVNSHDPYHLTVKDLLYNNECDSVTSVLGKKLGEKWDGIKTAAMKKSMEWEDIRVMKKYVFRKL